MNATAMALVQFPLMERLGWTLLHSLWQCAAAAALLAIVLPLLRQAQGRYLAGCLALLLAVTAASVTFLVIATEDAPAIRTVAPAAIAVQSGSALPWHAALPWAAAAWLCGVAVLSSRQIGAWMVVQGLRRDARPIDDRAWRDRMTRLMNRLGIDRAVILADSAVVQVPSVLGLWRPIILVPCSALSDLSPHQLESLLAHELAHIRRYDYLINLTQTVIETLLFYHPAVWWMSRLVRQEREHCCDDLAVSVVGDARAYSEALVAMEELRALPETLALAANGGSLVHRIRRLIKPEPRRASVIWPTMLLMGLTLGLTVLGQTGKPADDIGQSNGSIADSPAAATDMGLTLQPPVAASGRAIPPTASASGLVKSGAFDILPSGVSSSGLTLSPGPATPHEVTWSARGVSGAGTLTTGGKIILRDGILSKTGGGTLVVDDADVKYSYSVGTVSGIVMDAKTVEQGTLIVNATPVVGTIDVPMQGNVIVQGTLVVPMPDTASPPATQPEAEQESR